MGAVVASLPHASRPIGRTRPDPLHYPLSARMGCRAPGAGRRRCPTTQRRAAGGAWVDAGDPAAVRAPADCPRRRLRPQRIPQLAPVAVQRLRQTVRAMLAISFGSEAERERAIGVIKGIHRRVNGQLRDDVGPFPAGDALLGRGSGARPVGNTSTLSDSIVLGVRTARRSAHGAGARRLLHRLSAVAIALVPRRLPYPEAGAPCRIRWNAATARA